MALISDGGDGEVIGLTVPVWVVALISYLLGFGATIASVKDQQHQQQT